MGNFFDMRLAFEQKPNNVLEVEIQNHQSQTSQSRTPVLINVFLAAFITALSFAPLILRTEDGAVSSFYLKDGDQGIFRLCWKLLTQPSCSLDQSDWDCFAVRFEMKALVTIW
jgi:hypothetical protein